MADCQGSWILGEAMAHVKAAGRLGETDPWQNPAFL